MKIEKLYTFDEIEDAISHGFIMGSDDECNTSYLLRYLEKLKTKRFYTRDEMEEAIVAGAVMGGNDECSHEEIKEYLDNFDLNGSNDGE